MKISRLEFVLLLLTAACLAFFAGWFLGGQSAGETVRITTAAAGPVSPSMTAASPSPAEAEPPETGPQAERPQASLSASGEPEEQTGLVNINTADSQALQSLPGIGEKRAEAIIAHREENGPFRIVEDITDVTGIGEGILAQIIDKITVE